MFQRFCKPARSASRQRENFIESLYSDGSATYLLIIWVEKSIPLTMKSKQKPYLSIVFLSILLFQFLALVLSMFSLNNTIPNYFKSTAMAVVLLGQIIYDRYPNIIKK